MSYDDIKTSPRDFVQTCRKAMGKISTMGTTIDNNGKYWTVVCNAWQYKEILKNIYIIIGQYLNFPKNIIST